MRTLNDDDKKTMGRALTALYRGSLDEADRLFRTMGTHWGVALVAFHKKAWERAAGKALRFLAAWDAAAAAEKKGTESDEAVMLRILAIAVDRIGQEPLRGGAQRRREALVERARQRLANVDWSAVHPIVRRMARTSPEIFGPIATARLRTNLVREEFARTADLLLLDGDYHRAWSLIFHLAPLGAGPKTTFDFPRCPHCFDEITEESTRHSLREDLRAHAIPEYRKAPADREHALLNGVEALHVAEFLIGGADDVRDLLDCADRLLIAAPGLAPTGEMEKSEGGALIAFVAFHRARIADVHGDAGGAVSLFEEAVASAVEPWSDRAADELARLRTFEEAKSRRQETADLRSRCEACRVAGDTEGERAALTQLLAFVDEDALVERLARLERDAAVPGWPTRAAEAVRRGARAPALLAALAEEATLRAPKFPREAVRLFRLAFRGGALEPRASVAFADALIATGRAAEAGKVYEELGAADPERYLPAARAYATGGETRHALAAIDSLLDGNVPLTSVRDGFAIAASVASPDLLRPVAEKVLVRDPEHAEARALLARLKEEETRNALETAVRRREAGLTAIERRAWTQAVGHLNDLPREFLDAETRYRLALAYEHVGKPEDALPGYASLPPSRPVLEGRARCQARLHRFAEARASITSLLDVLEDETPALGDDPDLRGLVQESRGDLRGAAGWYEDIALLESVADRARTQGDPIAEYEALARLVAREPARAAAVRDRMGGLDAIVPVRVKGRYAKDLPTLVLCDTNVLLAELLEDPSTPPELHELRRPSGAERLRGMRSSRSVRLAVTRTIARELRGVLLYRRATQEDEEAANAIGDVLARAEALATSMDVTRVAGVDPRPGPDDVANVRAFYAKFGGRLRKITDRKAGRAPERSTEIVRRRTRGRTRAPGLPEAADLRLLAEAAWLMGAAVPGIGRVAIASDDADFRSFRAEIERAFGVGVT